jgi:DNA (cytosine-5)-methyltransferase 1
MKSDELIDIELFAGAGGLAIGLQNAGFSPLHIFERDKHACETLRNSKALKCVVHEGDVCLVDWKPYANRVKLLSAGAPCQPFSLAGKHRAENDGRNLFPEVLRAVRETRPKGVLIENVRGLLRHAFRPYVDYVLRQLECPSIKPKHNELWQNHDERIRKAQASPSYEPEYHVQWRLRDAADYGVPQSRQRVFIVATRAGLPRYEFPSPTHSRAALIREMSTGKYWTKHDIAAKKHLSNLPIPVGNGVHLRPWVTIRDILAKMPQPAESEANSTMNHWTIPGARRYAGHAGSALDWPAKTIKAGVHGVPGGENTVVDDKGNFRYLTLRETAKIQTFPDQHFFHGARIHVTRQIGNAVPCLLAEAIARPLFPILNEGRSARDA